MSSHPLSHKQPSDTQRSPDTFLKSSCQTRIITFLGKWQSESMWEENLWKIHGEQVGGSTSPGSTTTRPECCWQTPDVDGKLWKMSGPNFLGRFFKEFMSENVYTVQYLGSPTAGSQPNLQTSSEDWGEKGKRHEWNINNKHRTKSTG